MMPNKKSCPSYNGKKIIPFWQRLNFVLGKHIWGQSIRKVQVEDGNCGILEFDTQEGVQNVIFSKVHWKRYKLAEEAPICKRSLRRQFGYMLTLPTARSVLDGSYDFLPDIDEATKELFEECAKILSTVPANLVTGIISQERWQQRWKKVKEDTSLSPSRLHFGNDIAGANCNYVSQFHALRVSLALKKGIVLELWANGLLVMLEKMFGVRLVSKLQAILLMEADFNAMDKEVYGVRMLEEARKYKLIPEEIFSEKIIRLTMEIWQKPCPTTLFANLGSQQQSHWSMPPTAVTVLHMPWLCSFSNPLAWRTRQ